MGGGEKGESGVGSMLMVQSVKGKHFFILCEYNNIQLTWLIRLQGYKLFSCSTQLSMKFILLINVKMQTIVGILTFISMINTALLGLESKKSFLFSILVFMSN